MDEISLIVERVKTTLPIHYKPPKHPYLPIFKRYDNLKEFATKIAICILKILFPKVIKS